MEQKYCFKEGLAPEASASRCLSWTLRWIVNAFCLSKVRSQRLHSNVVTMCSCKKNIKTVLNEKIIYHRYSVTKVWSNVKYIHLRNSRSIQLKRFLFSLTNTFCKSFWIIIIITYNFDFVLL